jgi:hypothetical protein
MHNILLFKKSLFIYFLLLNFACFSQSKKEMIAHQSFQIDSLSKVNRLKDDSLKINKAFREVTVKSLDLCKSENSALLDSNKQLKSNLLELTNKKTQLEAENKAIEIALNSAKKTIDSLTELNHKLTSIQFKTNCLQDEKINPNSLNPVKTKTCESNFIRTISKSELDFGGKNHQSFELFIKRKDVFEKIKNEELFNESKAELLGQINAQLEYSFNATKKEHAQCLNEITFSPITFENLGISLSEKSIDFHYDFGYSKTCMKSFGTLLEYPLEDIEKYLIKFE